MEPLRRKSLAGWIAPLLLVGLLVQSGAWVCGCPEHNPWLLAVSHCVGDLAEHSHPHLLGVDATGEESNLDEYHIPGRPAYLNDVRPLAELPVIAADGWGWPGSEEAFAAIRSSQPACFEPSPPAPLSGGPLRARLQIYLL